MRIHWRLIPFVRITIAYITGIFIEKFFPGYTYHAVGLAIASLIILFSFNKHGRFIFYSGYLLLALFLSLAYLRSSLAHPHNNFRHYGHYIQHARTVIGIVKEVPIKKNAYRTELEVQYVCDNGGNCHKVSNAMMLYFTSSDAICKHYLPGDKLLVYGQIKPIKPNTNPFAFDYRQFLYYKNISHQIFAKTHLRIDKGQLPFIQQKAMEARAYCVGVFNKHMTSPDRAAILSAMVLGFRNEVNEEINQAFLDTGSVHILAVSGMHLVFLAAMLNWIFRKIKFKFPFVELIITLTILWFFTFMTGAAPAIVRAAIMFTFILIGKQYGARFNMFNILACCALLMLVYDPFQIFQTGFLFSFVALISLAFFHPFIKKWFVPQYTLLEALWEYVSVAIAAQVLMWPMMIYFFHKLPTYFIISGVLPVFLSNIAMNLSIALLTIAELPLLTFINEWILAPILNGVMYLFIQSVVMIKHIPYCSIDGLTLNEYEFILLMAALILLVIYLQTFKVLHLYAIGGVLLLCIISFTIRIHQANHQSVLTIYDIPKSVVIDIFDGRKLYAYTRDSLSKNIQDNACKNNRMYHMVEDTVMLDMAHDFYMDRMQKVSNIFRIKNLTFGVIDHESKLCQHYVKCDYLIITEDISYQPCIHLNPKTIIVLTNALKPKSIEEWKNRFDKNKLHCIIEQGALTINIKS